ncbi:hypothetical protein HK097_007410 [Rhizophlyctis rosea]|uniref:Uncharacterized protein n=1 Tax=Rhizophlyctis rosea TaxID=64517 RepID=A0AAD5X8P2_9FUNG|nr:hypothetical protein HK097_007410 [Rhizophlyctis rosea]
MIDDIAGRFYPFWASRVVDPKSFDVDQEYDTEEGRAKTVSGVCVNVANLGTSLAGLTKNDLKPALDELADRYRNLMPQPEVITRLSARKDVMSVDQWCEVFDGHVPLTLESELVWPVAKPIVV